MILPKKDLAKTLNTPDPTMKRLKPEVSRSSVTPVTKPLAWNELKLITTPGVRTTPGTTHIRTKNLSFSEGC